MVDAHSAAGGTLALVNRGDPIIALHKIPASHKKTISDGCADGYNPFQRHSQRFELFYDRNRSGLLCFAYIVFKREAFDEAVLDNH